MRFSFCRTIEVLATALTLGSSSWAALVENPSKPASELIQKQEPAQVTARLMNEITPENARLLISLSKQRAYLMLQEQTAIDTPVSTGKRSGMTPVGKFTITEKNKEHQSNIYGDFVDARGRKVRTGVSVKIDSAPSGTRFVGTPMRFFMRLTNTGIGLHVGALPGYPASHGCIRLPADIAPLIFEKVKVGTPVEVVP